MKIFSSLFITVFLLRPALTAAGMPQEIIYQPHAGHISRVLLDELRFDRDRYTPTSECWDRYETYRLPNALFRLTDESQPQLRIDSVVYTLSHAHLFFSETIRDCNWRSFSDIERIELRFQGDLSLFYISLNKEALHQGDNHIRVLWSHSNQSQVGFSQPALISKRY